MNPVEAVTAQALRDEQAHVHNPRRARTVFRLGVASLVLVLTCAAFRIWGDPGTPWDAVTSVILGGYAGAAALGRTRRGLAYRSGWIDGRMGMLASLIEARDRGMTMPEWVAGEMERDAHLLGVPWEHDEGSGGTQ